MTLQEKREVSDRDEDPIVKRRKAVVLSSKGQVSVNKSRKSGLLAPIMLLTGHEAEIYAMDFHPEGRFFATSGFDRKILLWNTYDNCENFATIPAHSGAVMQLHFSTDGEQMFTASTDKTLAVWDVELGVRTRKLKGHTMFVNTVCASRRGTVAPLLCSGSDDSTVRVWDSRTRGHTHCMQNTYQVTAVCFNQTADCVLSSGIDNDIKVWDLRKLEVLYTMKAHTDTVTGMSLSSDGSFLLSNSMDNSLRLWDIRPYTSGTNRCVRVFSGHQHNFEKNLLRCCWSPDDRQVSAGSADRFVYVWDAATCRILYKLPGHKGSVNITAFHPHEPIIASASSDKQIFLGELS